jgi:hypothetical protein
LEAEGRRQKAEGRRQKAEGRRQKAEGRRKTAATNQKKGLRPPQNKKIWWLSLSMVLNPRIYETFCLLPSSIVIF